MSKLVCNHAAEGACKLIGPQRLRAGRAGMPHDGVLGDVDHRSLPLVRVAKRAAHRFLRAVGKLKVHQ